VQLRSLPEPACLDGIFEEDASVPYVSRRNVLLGGSATPARWPNSFAERCDSELDHIHRALLASVVPSGIAAVTLKRPLLSEALVALAGRFGSAIPEHASEVQDFVEHEVLLNLRPVFQHTAAVERQPFASNFIALHTEGSLLPQVRRPTFLLFQCCEVDLETTGGYTVIVSIADVLARVSDSVKQVLTRTCYRGRAVDGAILRVEGDEQRLAFRDFMQTPLAWTFWSLENSGLDSVAVNSALRELHEAIYSSMLYHIPYAPGTVFLLDNRRFLHGRTRILVPESRRHLQRVRISLAANHYGAACFG
jgi:alpha-ketoglutarate-dependent taurine dioxygenase